MLKRSIIILVMGFGLVNCSTSSKIKLYSGPDLPTEQIVLVHVAPNIEIVSYNGEKPKIYASDNSYDLFLLSGKTEIAAFYREVVGDATSSVVVSSKHHVFRFETSPGAIYKLVFQTPRSFIDDEENVKNTKLWIESEQNEKITAVQIVESDSILKRLFNK